MPKDVSSATGEENGADWSTIAIAVFVFVVGFFIYQNSTRSSRSLKLHEETIAELRSLNERLERLERASAGEGSALDGAPLGLTSATADALERIDLNALRDGLYQVSAKVRFRIGSGDAETTKQYTVYHIKTQLEGGSGEPQPFHAGVATSGYLTTPKLYVDYDGDGIVDIHPMYELIKLVPFHQLISGSVNPRISQEVYAAFLLNSEKASFTTTTQIANHGNAFVRGLWQVITEKSNEIVQWGMGNNEKEELKTEEGADTP